MRDKDLYARTLNIGRAMELEVVIGPGDAGEVGLRVLRSPGEEGQTTISGRVPGRRHPWGWQSALRAYPTRPDSTGVSVFPYGGAARLVSLTAYRMASVWPEFERDQLRCRGVAR